MKRILKRPPGILTVHVHGGNSQSAFSSRSMRCSGPGVACTRVQLEFRKKKMKFPAFSSRVPYMQMYVRENYMRDESDYIGRAVGAYKNERRVCAKPFISTLFRPLVLTFPGIVFSNTRAVSA